MRHAFRGALSNHLRSSSLVTLGEAVDLFENDDVPERF
jgi:hypothetical protein